MRDLAQASSFRIDGLDCAEEVAVLKRALGPLVGGEEHLSFEILNGKMTILGSAAELSHDEIVRAVARTGMTARAWRDDGASGGAAVEDPFWHRRGRSLLCWASGALLAAAFARHAYEAGGALSALRAESLPPLAIALYLAATIAGAWFIFPKALYAARSLRPDMNLLMIVAVIGAIGIGEWFEAATVSFLFALALLLERWSVGRARRAIGALMELSPDVARVVDPETGETREQAVETVAVADLVRVRPGDKIPLDGEVVEGATAVDQSAITGESMPVPKQPGAQVFAGTVNGTGTIDVRVTRAAQNTTLAGIVRLVAQAQAQRSPSEQWVERFARYYTPIMMALALAVATLPPLIAGDWALWFYRALVLLVIACPCALVLSTPVSVVAGLAAAARAGVLIKGGSHLEAPAGFRAIAFDKTGTLTHGRPRVQRIVGLNGHTEEEVLARAAALETDSSHPLALAVLAESDRRGICVERAESVTAIPGKGAEGIVDGRPFWIGSHRLMEEKGAETPEFHRLAVELEDAGHSLVAVGNEDHICGLLGVADGVREDTAAVLERLRTLGVERLVMLTGDNDGTARAVAEAVGLEDYQAELLPQEKVAAVAALGEKFGSVAMVGDGVNDAPALATATTGIAMGVAGSDAAIETADIALMSDDLGKLPWLISHSRRVLRTIRRNIFFSLAVKAAFVGLAAAGMATLWMAIAADMGASLLVVANGLRLLRTKPGAVAFI